jgi:hypothetical protein
LQSYSVVFWLSIGSRHLHIDTISLEKAALQIYKETYVYPAAEHRWLLQGGSAYNLFMLLRKQAIDLACQEIPPVDGVQL